MKKLFAALLLASSAVAQTAKTGLPAPGEARSTTGQEPKPVSGSGFVAGVNGTVVTNYHVVRNCAGVRVATTSGLTDAQVIARDETNDLAALRVNANLTPLAMAGTPLELGSAVTVLGYPLTGVLGVSVRVTAGLVSSLSVQGDNRIMQISAAVQPGNSGGPVLDEHGAVVGIVVAKLADRFKAENVNFAIRVPVLKAFLDVNGIEYLPAKSDGMMRVAEIVKRSTPSTVLVVCDPQQARASTAVLGGKVLPPPAALSDSDRRKAADSVRGALSWATPGSQPPVPEFPNAQARSVYLRWLGQMSRRLSREKPDWQERKEFLQAVWYESKRAGLDPGFLLGLIQVESNFRKFEMSSVGARGYMQVMPFWTRVIGDGDASKLFHMQANLRFGCTSLRHFLDVRRGNLREALLDYVANNLTLKRTDPRAIATVDRIMAAGALYQFQP